MNILVSACLLGVSCRYDGKSKPNNEVIKLKEKYTLIPVCPEVAGGLKVPRTACEIIGDKVVSKNGEDRTEQYTKGANCALKLACKFNCRYAVLKENSPSCSPYKTYDGSFSGVLCNRKGITANLLCQNNIKVIGENHLEELINDGL